MKVLTEADGLMLGSLCNAVSTIAKAQQKLKETGPLLKAPSGYPMQNPLIAIINQATDTLIRLCREFGLSPASRTRIQTAIKESDIDSILDF
jgi:P27 family predicted phage terminase small subunit